jgi:hypothetical protein
MGIKNMNKFLILLFFLFLCNSCYVSYPEFNAYYTKEAKETIRKERQRQREVKREVISPSKTYKGW